MFYVNDVVVIICEHPVGAIERVFGRIGIVTAKTIDNGELYYDVKDVTGSEYAYDDYELRDADWKEVREAFVELVKERC